jgi:hypothetical protein
MVFPILSLIFLSFIVEKRVYFFLITIFEWFVDEKVTNGLFFLDNVSFIEQSLLYDNNMYHEECLRCNACAINLTGVNQKRARRFKNQILCDLHFAGLNIIHKICVFNLIRIINLNFSSSLPYFYLFIIYRIRCSINGMLRFHATVAKL